jgi:methylated-DNA-protein-cysteine methyltransferase related protein
MRRKKPIADLFLPLRATGAGRGARPAGEDNPALQAIWDVVCRIPQGQVCTYGAVARAAGLPGRARQTGFALRVAPEGMNLPWHRVVGAGGRIVFPKTSLHYREQARRLRTEGVKVRQGRVEASAVVDPIEW